jgi:hypothetical protein
VSFIINDRQHHIGYYLIDSIYLSRSVIMKGVHVPQQKKY